MSSARQVTGIQARGCHGMFREALSQQLGLLVTGIVQGNVGPTLKPPGSVVGGASVTDECEKRGRSVGGGSYD